MDTIRRYGITLALAFIITIAFALIKKDDLQGLTARLVFMAWFSVPTLMIIYGSGKK